MDVIKTVFSVNRLEKMCCWSGSAYCSSEQLRIYPVRLPPWCPSSTHLIQNEECKQKKKEFALADPIIDRN